MKLITQCAFLILAVAVPSFAAAEHDRLLAIQDSCSEMQTKIIAGDADAGLKFVFPKLIELVGGPAQMVEYLRKGAELVQKKGATMLCSTPAQISQVGTRLLALVPVLTTTTVVDQERGNGIFKQWSSTLAISENQGASWYFLNVSDKGVPEELLSGGIGNIIIPPKDAGVFSPISATVKADAQGNIDRTKIEYRNVQEAFATLRVKPGVEISVENGWTIISESAQKISWQFAPEGNTAYPSVVKMSMVQKGENLTFAMDVICEAKKEYCESFAKELTQLVEKMRAQIEDETRAAAQPGTSR